MSNTTIAQARKAILAGGVTKFEVTTTVVDKGSFPNNSLFLMQIFDADDPKEDSLVRIAGLGDIEQYSTSRSETVATSKVYYLASQFTKRYDTLDVAIAAYRVIRDRINNLVLDYDKYYAEFDSASGASQTSWVLPLVDYSLLATRILDFKASSTEVTTATADATTADAALTQARVNQTVQDTRLDTAQTVQSITNQLTNQIATLAAGVTVLSTIVGGVGAPPAQWGLDADAGSGISQNCNRLITILGQEMAKWQAEITQPTGGGGAINIGLLEGIRVTLSAERDVFLNRINSFATTANTLGGPAITDARVVAAAPVDTSKVVVELNAAHRAVDEATRTLRAATQTAKDKAEALQTAKVTYDKTLAAVLALAPDFDILDPDKKIRDELG